VRARPGRITAVPPVVAARAARGFSLIATGAVLTLGGSCRAAPRLVAYVCNTPPAQMDAFRFNAPAWTVIFRTTSAVRFTFARARNR
jgi:hypothetical protein